MSDNLHKIETNIVIFQCFKDTFWLIKTKITFLKFFGLKKIIYINTLLLSCKNLISSPIGMHTKAAITLSEPYVVLFVQL